MSLTTLSDNITTNGLYEYDPPAGYDGFSSATINVNVTTTPNLTPGSTTITSNGTIEIDPPAGYDGFSSFTVTTNVTSIQYTTYRLYISDVQEGPYYLGYNALLNNLVWQYSSSATTYTVYTDSILVLIYPASFTLPSTNNQGLLSIQVYLNISQRQVNIPAGSWYMYAEPNTSITGMYALSTFGTSDDDLLWLGVSNMSANRTQSAITDMDDIPFNFQ